jgi:hypothetical protein
MTAKHLYARTSVEERMAMCMVAVLAIRAERPVGITLQELNGYLAACGMQQLNDHNDWIGLMEHKWEFRHGWDGTFSDEGRLNGPWPQKGTRSYLDGYYYDREGNCYCRAEGGDPAD